MLQESGVSAGSQPQQSQRTWEHFCREEAREAASAFLERVRRFKSRHTTARDVHDSTFTNEFSAAFLEESTLLMASGGTLSPTNPTGSLPGELHGRVGRSRETARQRGDSKKTSWWSGLFKLSKSKRSKERHSSESSTSSVNSASSNRLQHGGSTRQKRKGIRVVKETVLVQLLNLSECDIDEASWSTCKLMLVEQQGNYQIEIYCPPKSPMPKMSLFCFLIEEVRSTTSLEIPDSNSCFAIKSQNHGEYVFDVKAEDLKEEWVRAIQAYSLKNTATNGHLPRASVASHSNSPIRSHLSNHVGEVIGGEQILDLEASPLLFNRTCGARSALTNSGPAVAKMTNVERHSSVSDPRKVAVMNTEMTRGASGSEESVLEDMTSFMRNYTSTRSPNRQRKTLSMFVDPSLPQLSPLLSFTNPYVQSNAIHTQHSVTPSPSHGTTLAACSTHVSSNEFPPPVPQRGQRSQSLHVKNCNAITETASPTFPPLSPTVNQCTPLSTTISNIYSNSSSEHRLSPKRKISQPTLGLPSSVQNFVSDGVGSMHDLPSPGNLETCSQSSSSSALHPVSIAALARRSSTPYSPTDGESMNFLSVQPVGGGNGSKLMGKERVRKVSAPVLPLRINDGSGIAKEDGGVVRREDEMEAGVGGVEEGKAAGKVEEMVKRGSEERTVVERERGDEENGKTQKEKAEVEQVSEVGASETSDVATDVPPCVCSPLNPPSLLSPLTPGFCEGQETSNHVMMTFPYYSQQSNPTLTQTSRVINSKSSTISNELRPEEQPTHSIPQDLDDSHHQIPAAFPQNNDSISTSMRWEREGATSQNSNHTNPSIHSSSSLEDRDSNTRAESATSNPIYIETTESQGYSQTTLHTRHPYASWATNQQDITNLRVLSQYPWFHGMISRSNASQLVVVDGDRGTGQYLVRQSESREGDFVLTFNYHNRAKHLRMTVDSVGCNIQHLSFNSVPSMLEYFKTNSIPLESFWLNNDVKLTSYINREASDNFRTTTVLNVDQLNRVPPRRSRSLHLNMSHSIMGSLSSHPSTPSPLGIDQRQASSASSSTNSLPQTRTAATGWRQIFRSQRSSSAGNVGRIQRSHSHNAGTIQSTGRGGRAQQNNAYVWRNY